MFDEVKFSFEASWTLSLQCFRTLSFFTGATFSFFKVPFASSLFSTWAHKDRVPPAWLPPHSLRVPGAHPGLKAPMLKLSSSCVHLTSHNCLGIYTWSLGCTDEIYVQNTTFFLFLFSSNISPSSLFYTLSPPCFNKWHHYLLRCLQLIPRAPFMILFFFLTSTPQRTSNSQKSVESSPKHLSIAIVSTLGGP